MTLKRVQELSARVAELEAELKEAKQEAFNSGAMVLHLRDVVAKLEAEYTHLDEVASKTIGLLTTERDQPRQHRDYLVQVLKELKDDIYRCERGGLEDDIDYALAKIKEQAE